RDKGADDEAIGHERRMHAGWYMVTMAHHRSNVAPVEPHGREVALPAYGIERVERIGDRRDRTAALHLDTPFHFALLCAELVVQLRRIERCRVEERVRAKYAAVGQLVAAVCRLDHQ